MDRIYLDQGATTFPKPERVYKAVEEGMRNSFNPNRGSYQPAQSAERRIEKGRRRLLRFFASRKDHRLVFTYSGTDGLNTLLYGLINKESTVICSPYEHNAVYRPLKDLGNQGMNLKVAQPDGSYGIDLGLLEEECRKGIDYGVFSYTSNVTGISLPIDEIAKIIHKYGGKVIVDGAQGAGHQKISLKEEGIDFFASSGHKGLMGPMGTGFIILPEDSHILPFRKGGTGILSELEEMPKELPYRLESGTLNVPGIYGLIAGVEWIEANDILGIHKKEIDFVNRCMGALGHNENIEIFSRQDRSQIFSFTIGGKDSQSVAAVLDQAYGISLRGGLHCSPLAHKTLGTFPEGTIRASFSIFTKDDEIDRFIKAVEEISLIK